MATDDGFARFYAAVYPRLVGQLLAVTGGICTTPRTWLRRRSRGPRPAGAPSRVRYAGGVGAPDRAQPGDQRAALGPPAAAGHGAAGPTGAGAGAVAGPGRAAAGVGPAAAAPPAGAPSLAPSAARPHSVGGRPKAGNSLWPKVVISTMAPLSTRSTSSLNARNWLSPGLRR